MKIISKTKDYYDTALGFGVDGFFFNRKSEEIVFSNFIEKKEFEKLFREYNRLNNVKDYRIKIGDFFNFKILNIKNKILFFCGNYYPLIEVEFEEKNKINKFVFYKFDEFNDFITKDIKKGSEKEFDLFWNKNNKNLLKENKKWFYDFFNIKINEIEVFFHKLNACYFSISHNASIFEKEHKYKIDVYPILKDIEFQKTKNPYECLQEINQYLSGVLASTENNILEIEDKYKIESHGYDIKKSFRKRK